MIYINFIYTNICDFVSNIIYLPLGQYEFINMIKNNSYSSFDFKSYSKINLIENIYNTYKPKKLSNNKLYIDTISNTDQDNYNDDNCDWGWFIIIDDIHKK